MYNMQEFMEWHEYLETVDRFEPETKQELLEADYKLEELEC